MIGSHNSLTSYPAKCKIFNLFKWLWRCQTLTFKEQLDFVDYFDIRISLDKKGNITFCHGLVDLRVSYTLHSMLEILQKLNKQCRIVIEKGVIPTPEVLNWIKSYSCVQEIVYKKHWKVLYSNNLNVIVNNYYIPYNNGKSFWNNLKAFRFSTPKLYAKKVNPKGYSYTVYKENAVIYLYDYVEIFKM